MNAKQRKLVRKTINEILKQDVAIDVTPTFNSLGQSSINLKINGIDYNRTIAILAKVPTGLNFDRIGTQKEGK